MEKLFRIHIGPNSEYILARMLKEVFLLPPGEGQDEGI
jgi:hypothetical protein